MENKFKFLTKYSLSKKLKNKWFLIVNIILAFVIISLVNIDNVVNFFGGDFNDEIKIKIVDNVGYYNNIKSNLDNIKNYLPDSKIKIQKEKYTLKKAKNIIKDTNDILLIINKDETNIFKYFNINRNKS